VAGEGWATVYVVVIFIAECMWSGVVSGTQAAVLPAFRPTFRAVPLLHSTSNVDIVPSSTSPLIHSLRESPLSSCSKLSREDISAEQDGIRVNCDAQRLSAAVDSSLHREESHDSGGVFLTPPSASHLGPKLLSESGNSKSLSADVPVSSLVYVGRKFGRPCDSGDEQSCTKDISSNFVSQSSSPSDIQTVSEATKTTLNHDDAIKIPAGALHIRRTSFQGTLYHRSDEEFITPSKTKKKTKRSRRACQPGQLSMMVYGGNPKWIWKS